MKEEDAFHELIRILKTRFGKLKSHNKKKQTIELKLNKSQGRKKKFRIGIASDIEGATDNSISAAQKMRKEGVESIIIVGDCYENHEIRPSPMYPGQTDKKKQMKEGLEPFLRLKVPTYVVPGNHENSKIYHDIIKELRKKFPLVKDMHKKRLIMKGFGVVFLGGYHISKMTDPEGFVLDEHDYEWVDKSVKEIKKKGLPVVLITHGPPLSPGMLDFLPFFGNVGDEVLSDIISSFDGDLMNLHGHIHEKSGERYMFGDNISINISSITNFSNPRFSNSAVLDIEEKRIVYREI